MIYIALVGLALACAFQAMMARQLLASALWLAGVSASVAILLYGLGARTVAVIELSVGAGLVTVLFVFAINIAGDDGLKSRAVVPFPLTIGLLLIFVALLGWMVLPFNGVEQPAIDLPFLTALWEDRALDTLVQVLLIFVGVLGLLAILKDSHAALADPQNIFEEDIAKVKTPLTSSVGVHVPGAHHREVQS